MTANECYCDNPDCMRWGVPDCELDIPEWLRITPEREAERREAWRRNPPRAMPAYGGADTTRRGNLTAHDLEVIATLEGSDASERRVREIEKDQKAAERRAAKAVEKAELAAVAKAAAQTAAETKKRFHGPRRAVKRRS